MGQRHLPSLPSLRGKLADAHDPRGLPDAPPKKSVRAPANFPPLLKCATLHMGLLGIWIPEGILATAVCHAGRLNL